MTQTKTTNVPTTTTKKIDQPNVMKIQLPSLKHVEPDNDPNLDQRPLARYLRHLHANDPSMERKVMQTLLRTGKNRDIDVATAYLDPTRWCCEMHEDDKFGRYLVADQDIAEGCTIGAECPIMYVSLPGTNRCCECDRELVPSKEVVKCTKHGCEDGDHCCPLTFCSTQCRDWAWGHYHQHHDPKAVAALYDNGDLDTIFAWKVLSMMCYGEENEYALKYIMAFLQNPHIVQSASKIHLHPLMVEEFGRVVGCNRFLKSTTAKTVSDALQEMVPLLVALKKIYSFGQNSTLAYLFGPGCLINHSCEPNVTVGVWYSLSYDSPDLAAHGIRPYAHIKAERPIKKGEQLFFDYRGTTMKPRSMRKADLKLQYGFDCQCRLCNTTIVICDYDGCKKHGVQAVVDKLATACPKQLGSNERPGSSGGIHMKRCMQCKDAAYCSKDCQRLDWKHHKKYCVLVSEARKKRRNVEVPTKQEETMSVP